MKVFLFVFIALAMLLNVPGDRTARAQGSGNLLNIPQSQVGSKMFIQADEMVYENDSDKVVASGNVEVYYDDNFLSADKVIYDRKNEKVTATGNVRFRDSSGNVIFSDEFVVTGDFREGFVRAVQVLTPENARIVAADATRLAGNVVIFNKVVYTACAPYPGKPDRAPLWRIKATRIVHNQQEKMVEMRNTTFELFGMPVAWFPYFKHPDPTVKRQSGFLFPTVRLSDELGVMAEIPYFWAIAPNYDLTYSPVFMTKQGVLHKGVWRHRLSNGEYTIRAAGIYQLDPDQFVSPGNRDWRGMLETAGEFRINSKWKWGWSAAGTSDETFLNVYNLRTDNTLTSQLHLTGLGERNFFQAKVFHFENLRARGTSPLINENTGAALPIAVAPFTAAQFMDSDQALVHPVVDYNFIFPGAVAGGELSANFSLYSLTRNDGPDASRAVADMRWRRQFTDSLGQRFTPFFDFRGDIYHVNDVLDQNTGLQRNDETIARGMATAGMEYSYPFISATSWGSHVIEPVAQILARPNQQARERLPNEDAKSLVFDDTNLFEHDKFSGFDRTEGGVRANVGLKYTLQTNNFGYGSVLFGQSYHLAGRNPFVPGTGLGRDTSDWVGAIYLAPIPAFSASSRVTFDSDTFKLKRHELDAQAVVGPLSVAINYADFRGLDEVGVENFRQELAGSSSLSITDHWKLFADLRYDVDDSRLAQASVGVGYFCDCGYFRLDYKENFFRDRDDRPDRSIVLTYFLKTLGGGQVATDVGSLFNEQASQ